MRHALAIVMFYYMTKLRNLGYTVSILYVWSFFLFPFLGRLEGLPREGEHHKDEAHVRGGGCPSGHGTWQGGRLLVPVPWARWLTLCLWGRPSAKTARRCPASMRALAQGRTLAPADALPGLGRHVPQTALGRGIVSWWRSPLIGLTVKRRA